AQQYCLLGLEFLATDDIQAGERTLQHGLELFFHIRHGQAVLAAEQSGSLTADGIHQNLVQHGLSTSVDRWAGRAGKGGQSTTAAGGGQNGAVAKSVGPVHVTGAARLRLRTAMVRHCGAEDGRLARVSSYPAVFEGKRSEEHTSELQSRE